MIRPVPPDCEWRTVLPATLDAVEEFFVEFRRRSAVVKDPSHCFAAELLIREALTNAVVHGCRCDPGKRVHCWLRFRDRTMLIAVQDEGCGFDWRSARNSAAEISSSSGRGMEILRIYADRVRFNDRGTRVTIIKRFGKGKKQ